MEKKKNGFKNCKKTIIDYNDPRVMNSNKSPKSFNQ